ncbi:M3 family metallopeptidase [Pedobacter rhodius]|uniref:M3 family metallopeptidase n=1 Tax=Pedobacter rhodius TaxID=3004098 RepID=A0ABT4KYM6_9SPHI|nr:M3 family metallopeptidase [Pedobacter sp. SJ11]MCZ4224040.1 M3 family metallopeptidase [Pedobacter sp. SJ11]
MQIIRNLILSNTVVLLTSFFISIRAQSFDPFSGQSTKFHVNLSRYFKSENIEANKRNILFSEVDRFINDSLWTTSNLYKKLKDYDRLLISLKKHYEYYRLLNYRDNRDTISRYIRNQVEEKLDKLDGYLTQSLSKDEIKTIFTASYQPKSLATYKYFVDQRNKSTDFQLSLPEQIRLQKIGKRAVESLTEKYDRLMDEIDAPDIILADGVKLNPIRNRNVLLQSKDHEVRKATSLAYHSAYNVHGEMMATTLIDIAKQNDLLSKLQGFKNAPQRNYKIHLQLPEDSVRSLLLEMPLHADVFKAYQKLLAEYNQRGTDLEKVNSYDLLIADKYAYKPLPFTEVKKLILDAMSPLGSTYIKKFSWLLTPENGAMEIAGGTGSRVNEYTSIGYAGVPVSLYMRTYNGTLSSLLTLSHEGGHAVHQLLMNQQLRIPSYASGPSFLFEAFAMLNELLVLDKLEEHVKDIKGKAYYTKQFLNLLSLEVFSSAEEGLFEQKLYDHLANGRSLTRENIDSLYANVMGHYDLFFPKEPERRSEWINKRLFFDDSLYSVNYLYAVLVAGKLYDHLHEHPKKFEARYLALLKNGFNAPATELFERFMGFKLDTKILLKSTLKLIRNKTETLRELYKQNEP